MQRSEEIGLTNEAPASARARTLGLAAYAASELFCALLWAFVACVAVAYWIFQAEAGAATCYFIALAAAFVGHVLAASSVVWLEYPYWLDVETLKETRNRTSRPIWLVNLILALVFARQTDLFTAFWALIAAILFDSIFAFYASRYAETIIRALRKSYDESRRLPTPALRATTIETPHAKETERESDALEEVDDGVRILSFERTRGDDEFERVSGTALVEFEPNASMATLNISFCPPFKGIPTFEFEQSSGEEATFKISTLQSFGVRIEARRALETESDEPVAIDFFAQYPSETS